MGWMGVLVQAHVSFPEGEAKTWVHTYTCPCLVKPWQSDFIPPESVLPNGDGPCWATKSHHLRMVGTLQMAVDDVITIKYIFIPSGSGAAAAS